MGYVSPVVQTSNKKTCGQKTPQNLLTFLLTFATCGADAGGILG